MFDDKKWRKENREHLRKSNRIWLRKNKDKVSVYRQRPETRFSCLKVSARSRGLKMTLTFVQYASLIGQNICSYCGGPLAPKGLGLDRQDHRKGYEPDNVVACCFPCNWKKGHLEGLGFTYPRTVELLLELNKPE